MKKKYFVGLITLVGLCCQSFDLPKFGDYSTDYKAPKTNVDVSLEKTKRSDAKVKSPELKVEFQAQTEHNGLIYRLFRFDVPNSLGLYQGIIRTKRMDGSCLFQEVDIHSDGSLWKNGKSYTHALNAGYGEKFEVVVFAFDKTGTPTPLASNLIIPFPAINKGKGSRVVELEASDPKGLNFVIQGTGFDPKAKISIDSLSGAEKISSEIVTDEKGPFTIVASPAVVGATEGSFALIGKENGEVTFEIDHYWGKIAFQDVTHYPELEKKYPKPPR